MSLCVSFVWLCNEYICISLYPVSFTCLCMSICIRLFVCLCHIVIVSVTVDACVCKCYFVGVHSGGECAHVSVCIYSSETGVGVFSEPHPKRDL